MSSPAPGENGEQNEHGLFDWGSRHRVPVVLPAFLFLSLFAHAATFFLFQIVYPQRVSLPLAAPQVTLLTPSVPEHQALLRQIEAEDPALAASYYGITPKGLLDIPYQPSFQTVRTKPQLIERMTQVGLYPPPKNPLDIIRSASATAVQPAVAVVPQVTRTVFSETIANRAPKEMPPWNLPRGNNVVLEAANFLIGVTDRGEVRFTFLQHSSGDEKVDTALASQIAGLSFQQAGDAMMTWGFATVHCGDDVYRTSPEDTSGPGPGINESAKETP